MATMVGAACFAVSGISETLGQEKEKSRPVYIATEEVAETTYTPEVEEATQPTETAKAVETEEPLIASMDWDKDDSYLLCKIAMAEAESEGVKGKALVMLVVLNRVWSNEFPDTIEEVIFQKNQFSPVANGRYDAVEPDEECYEALKLIQVDHWNESQDALYFESKSDSKWHSENLEFLFKYGKDCSGRRERISDMARGFLYVYERIYKGETEMQTEFRKIPVNGKRTSVADQKRVRKIISDNAYRIAQECSVLVS